MTTDPIAMTLPCGVRVPDRIAMAPLTNTQSHADGTLSDDELNWLVQRADGGFRWISTCATYVSGEGKAWDGQLGIAADLHLPGLTRLAQALREREAVGIVQLHHAGAKASLAPDMRLSTVDRPADTIRGATDDDLARVVEDFVQAAQRAEQAGFAGVEIHGANGYLFTQFLAPLDNPRTDGYGGDLVGRARLLREATRAVRAAVAPAFVVGVRLSPVDVWSQRGLVLTDSVQVGGWLAEDGADFIHLSLSQAAAEDASAGPIAAAFRANLPSNVAILAAGGMWTRADVAAALAAGVDVAVLGRSAIAHADWPRMSSAPGWQPVRPPWTTEHLTREGVGPALVRYLSGMAGMVVGGRPART